MDINELRNFLKENDFMYYEVSGAEPRECRFCIMTDKENEVVQVTYNDDKYGCLSFDNANVVRSSFDFYADCLKSMLLNGQYRRITCNRGSRVINM